jgi:rhodanese-related sulfurtransferase
MTSKLGVNIMWIVVAVTIVIVVVVAMKVKGNPSDDIAAAELQAAMKTDAKPLLIDVRSPGEFAGGHIPGAVLIPHTKLIADPGLAEAKPDQPIVTYCKAGPRARAAQKALINAGHANVRHLTGDMSGWQAAGLPVER